LKVLHIISSSGMYGAEAVILNIMEALRHGPHSASLGVFANASNLNLELHEAALRQGFESETVPCSGQFDRTTLSALRDLCARSGANVVHAHGYKADIYVRLALRGRVPLVSTCHTWYDNDALVTLYGRLDRFVLRAYTRVVAVSEEVRHRLLKAGVSSSRIRMVRNGVDVERFAGAVPSLPRSTDGALTVGLVGRLASEKGVDVFLIAAARVLQQSPETRFVIAGDGPDREKLERMLDELNIRSSVTLLGRREDMPSIYVSLDVMVSASRQEGLPIAILEGMASSRPIVATPVGEVPALIADRQTGLIVPADDAESLAGAISVLLRDAQLRARLGSAARKRIEDEYSSPRMTADYVRVYAEAIEETGGVATTTAARGPAQ
jgi:glycosyltransferase involved in cell wall biosynthesis